MRCSEFLFFLKQKNKKTSPFGGRRSCLFKYADGPLLFTQHLFTFKKIDTFAIDLCVRQAPAPLRQHPAGSSKFSFPFCFLNKMSSSNFVGGDQWALSIFSAAATAWPTWVDTLCGWRLFSSKKRWKQPLRQLLSRHSWWHTLSICGRSIVRHLFFIFFFHFGACRTNFERRAFCAMFFCFFHSV